MTAPEKEAPNVFRAAMTRDPKLEGLVMLMLDNIMPALQHGRDYGIKAFPADDAEVVAWTNGAIFGVVAQYVTANSDAGLDGIAKLYACVSDVISQTLDTYGCFDLEQYTQDFLVRVGAAEEATQ